MFTINTLSLVYRDIKNNMHIPTFVALLTPLLANFIIILLYKYMNISIIIMNKLIKVDMSFIR